MKNTKKVLGVFALIAMLGCLFVTGCDKDVTYTCENCGTEYATEEEKNACAVKEGCPGYKTQESEDTEKEEAADEEKNDDTAEDDTAKDDTTKDDTAADDDTTKAAAYKCDGCGTEYATEAEKNACAKQKGCAKYYYITFDKDISSAITVNLNEELVLTTSASNGTWLINEENLPKEATITKGTDADGKVTFTIKGVKETASNVSFGLYPEEAGDDTSFDQTITVYVYNPVFTVTLSLDDEVAEKAASISVYYEGKEDSETTAALYDTVAAAYTAGETTATVDFKKAKANSYDWFNNIAVTVKDADGNEISTSATPVYFCWSAKEGNGYLTDSTINVVAKAASKTFTINFSGFTIPGGTVSGLKYSNAWADSSADWTDDMITTPAVTVAEDGTSATFSVESSTLTDKSEFYIDWTAVTFADKDGNAVTISSGLEVANQWYSYAETDEAKWEITASYVVIDTSSETTLKSNLAIPSGSSVTELVAAADMPSDATSITLTYTVGESDAVSSSTWISVYSDSSWSNTTKLVNAWDTGFEVKAAGGTYSVTIKSVSDFIAGGIYIASDDVTYTGTITITYTK